MNRTQTKVEAVTLTARQRRVLAAVQELGFATIESLARQFAVSSQTVRRDIIKLQEENYLQRFHGGAGLADGSFRVGYAQKLRTSPQGKRRIGEAVAAMIPDGAAVFLDVGTTVEAVARALLVKADLRVFTCSASVAMILCTSGKFEVFVTGGVVRGANGSLVGGAAINQINALRTDYAVIGFGGFDDDGSPMDFDLEKIAVRQAALARTRHGIAVADTSKFEKIGVARIAPLSAFHAVVTDGRPPAKLQASLKKAGVRAVVAAG
jgi:DeoR family glycerol-3-phosphate regulon repressor